MDTPNNIDSLVSEFVGITGCSGHVAEHYLSACNFDLNRAVEFYFEHPPGPGAADGAPIGQAQALGRVEPNDDDEAGYGPPVSGAGFRPADEDLDRALAESLAAEERGGRPPYTVTEPEEAGPALAPGPGPGGSGRSRAARQPAPDVEVLDADEDEEELPGADDMLEAMARRRQAALAAERAARGHMEEMMDRMLGAMGAGRVQAPGTVLPPPGYPGAGAGPGALPSMFPGLPPGLLPPGLIPPLVGRGVGAPHGGPRRPGSSSPPPGWGDVDMGIDDEAEGLASRRTGPAPYGRGAGQAQRRRMEVAAGGAGAARAAQAEAGAGAEAEPRDEAWDEGLELPEGMSRHELEEARMMEAALLGVPYQGRLPDFTQRREGGGAAPEVAPELVERRELRWDQDRAYEESLAADRAKAEAAERARAEAEAAERARRQAEEEAAQAAAEEAFRLESLLAAKVSQLPAEPPASAADAVNVMVRLPDGSRHSRRFARADRLAALFDFVDVELDAAARAAAAAAPSAAADGAAAAAGSSGTAGTSAGAAAPGTGPAAGAALQPGSYRLVAQFPRRAFDEEADGGRTFEEAGLAAGGGAAFFIEQRGG